MRQWRPLVAPVLAVALLIGWLRLSAVLTTALLAILVLIVALIVWRSSRS
jgi:hypothetical protein